MEQNEITFLNEPQEVSMGDDWFAYANPTHFWLSWRYGFLKRYLKRIVKSDSKIMEIGCGNGGFRRAFEEDFQLPVDGCDLNLLALTKGDKGLGEVFVYDVYKKNEELKEKYDLVCLLDVIEHIDDDVEFIRASSHLLKPGGHLIINVPYSQILYSKYDVVAGHLRRYNKKNLHTTITQAGLIPSSIATWGFFLLPIAILRKFLLAFFSDEGKIIKTGFEPPSALVHKLLHILKSLELILPVTFPVGTSITAIAQKVSNED